MESRFRCLCKLISSLEGLSVESQFHFCLMLGISYIQFMQILNALKFLVVEYSNYHSTDQEVD